jgi:hypothetical protein
MCVTSTGAVSGADYVYNQCRSTTDFYAVAVSGSLARNTYTGDCVSLSATQCMDGAWVRTTTTKRHKHSSSGACVTVDTADSKCFKTDTNVEAAVTGNVLVNAATGRCVDVSTDKCQDGDSALALTNIKGRNPTTSACTTLAAGKCVDTAGAPQTPIATIAIDATFACRAVTDGQCWNDTADASQAVSATKSLHATTFVCVIGKEGECFDTGTNAYIAVKWDGLKGRKSDGTCFAKADTATPETKCIAAADGAEGTIGSTKASDANANCQTITDTHCWNGTVTTAPTSLIARNTAN